MVRSRYFSDGQPTIGYLGNPGEAYANNVSYLLLTLFGYLSIPIVISLFLNFFYRLQITSIDECLELRFNYAVRLLASLIFIASRLAWVATIVSAIFSCQGVAHWNEPDILYPGHYQLNPELTIGIEELDQAFRILFSMR